VAYLLGAALGLEPPRRLQIELARAVQDLSDSSGKEISASQIAAVFEREYLDLHRPHRYVSHRVDGADEHVDHAGAARAASAGTGGTPVEVHVETDGVVRRGVARAADVLEAATAAVASELGMSLTLLDHQRHVVGRAGSPTVAAYVELRAGTGAVAVHGAGQDADELTASLKALVSAANRVVAASSPSRAEAAAS
jgi:2-isopropylmalate synthase